MNLTFNPRKIEHPADILKAPDTLKNKYNERKYYRDKREFLSQGQDYVSFIKKRISAYKDNIRQKMVQHDDMSPPRSLKLESALPTEAPAPVHKLSIKQLTKLNMERKR